MLQTCKGHVRSGTWNLPISTSFTAKKPRFKLGQMVLMSKSFQIHRGIAYYGKIIGLIFETTYDHPNDGEWSYLIQAPDWHPLVLDGDTVPEIELLERMKGELICDLSPV